MKPSGYDLCLTEDAERWAFNDLDVRRQLDFRAAVEPLLRDPTEGNPYVTDASAVHGYQKHDYVMVWGGLTITHRFVNDLVAAVSAVRVLPRLGGGQAGAE